MDGKKKLRSFAGKKKEKKKNEPASAGQCKITVKGRT
jgi:hypothetical protein